MGIGTSVINEKLGFHFNAPGLLEEMFSVAHSVAVVTSHV